MDDTLPVETRRLIRSVVKAMRAEFDVELRAAVAAERAHIYHGLRTVGQLNGSGLSILKALTRADRVCKASHFVESEHPRDHGEFASKEGEHGGPSADDHRAKASKHREKAEKHGSEVEKAEAELPAAVSELARHWGEANAGLVERIKTAVGGGNPRIAKDDADDLFRAAVFGGHREGSPHYDSALAVRNLIHRHAEHSDKATRHGRRADDAEEYANRAEQRAKAAERAAVVKPALRKINRLIQDHSVKALGQTPTGLAEPLDAAMLAVSDAGVEATPEQWKAVGDTADAVLAADADESYTPDEWEDVKRFAAKAKRATEGVDASSRVSKAVRHAPEGGATVGGKEFRGGEFIPAEVWENATAEEKAKVQGGGEPEEAPPEPEEWDGTIDQDEVDDSRGAYADNKQAEYTTYDDGEERANTVVVQTGIFTTPQGDEVDVYRWQAQNPDGDEIESGEWTDDEGEAEKDADRHARRNHEDPPDPEDSDINGVDGQSWEDRDVIGNYTTEAGNERTVRLEEGTFQHFGQEHTCYRWTTRLDDDGEWTLDRRRAVREGERYAEDNHHEPEAADDFDPADVPDIEAVKRDVRIGDEKLPKSKASIFVADPVDEGTADAVVGKLFPAGKLADSYDALMESVGMPDDAEVEVVHVGPYKKLFSDDEDVPGAIGVRLKVKHPKMGRVSRFVGVDGDGRRFVKNEIIEIKPEHQGDGLGADIFSRQVQAAADHGLDYIVTHAAKGPGMNGFATWPKFGYDMSLTDSSIPSEDRPVFDEVQKRFPGVKTVQDLFARPGGEEWWSGKKNPDGTRVPGQGTDLYNARFDLTPDSRSMERLGAYLKKSKASTKTSASPPSRSPPSTPPGGNSSAGKTGSPKAAKYGKAFRKAFDPSRHPRDDSGRFVDAHHIQQAARDPAKAAELRSQVTDPEQRAKLDEAIAGQQKAGQHGAWGQAVGDAEAAKRAEWEDRMAGIDPRMSGAVDVPEKETPVSIDDRDMEAQARQADKLRRAEAWQADRPESVPAEEAVRRNQLPEDEGQYPAGPTPQPVKPAKLTVDQSEALVKRLMSASGPTTAETVRQLQEAFAGHTKQELDELKARLGIRASGPRLELARKLAERAAAYDRSNRNLYVNEKVSVDDAHDRITAMAADGTLRTPQGVTELTRMIAGGLTGDELKELKGRLGIRASGAKMEVARKLVERATMAKSEAATEVPTTATTQSAEVVAPQPVTDSPVVVDATNRVAGATPDVAPNSVTPPPAATSTGMTPHEQALHDVLTGKTPYDAKTVGAAVGAIRGPVSATNPTGDMTALAAAAERLGVPADVARDPHRMGTAIVTAVRDGATKVSNAAYRKTPYVKNELHSTAYQVHADHPSGERVGEYGVNMFWHGTEEEARQKAKELTAAGLTNVTIKKQEHRKVRKPRERVDRDKFVWSDVSID